MRPSQLNAVFGGQEGMQEHGRGKLSGARVVQGVDSRRRRNADGRLTSFGQVGGGGGQG